MPKINVNITLDKEAKAKGEKEAIKVRHKRKITKIYGLSALINDYLMSL